MAGPEPNKFGKNIPAVNGIISSLGWVTPLHSTNNHYYEPEGGIKKSTRTHFTKVLKERFGIDLESDFRSAYNRIFVSNDLTRMNLDEYYQKMEEYEIMPESKETYKLRQDAAENLENALFYEMAKGGLAIIPAGETEPRQIRCDVTPDTFVVTEPYSQCRATEIMKKYKVHEPVLQPVPAEPAKPVEPKPFTEEEPKWPDKPEPVKAKPPGKEPVPVRFMKRPTEPEKPLDPMRFGSKEALAEKIFKEKLEVSGLEEPKEHPEDPGVFTMEEPDVVEKPNVVIPEAPIRPEACDIEDQMAEDLDKDAPILDSKYKMILEEPGPFMEKEPVRPVMVRPAEVPDPVYIKLTEPPKIKYQYEFEEPEPPALTVPEKSLPDRPVLDLSDLKEPEYPELGEEPENPSGLARFFRIFSSETRRKIAAHDKWLDDRATLAQRREQWEKDHDAYLEKVELREQKHEKDLAEYEKLAEEYRKEAETYQAGNNLKLLRYTKRSEAYQEALNKFGGPDYITAKSMYRASLEKGDNTSSDPNVVEEHQKLKAEYEEQLQRAKAKLGVEKIREEQEHQKQLEKWEKDNQESIEVNLDKQAEFEKKLSEFHEELEKYDENFGECHDDPELIAQKYDVLEADYQEKLKKYFALKEEHEKHVKSYEESVKNAKEHAIKNGYDPEEAIEANRQYRIKEKIHEGKIDQYHEFQKDHPEIREYNDKLVDYEEAVQQKEWSEEKYEEYLEEKKEYDKAKLEYDQKKAAFDDIEEAKKQYKLNVENLKKEAAKEAETQIKNEQKALEDYKTKYEEYKKEDEYWVKQKAIFDENVRKMYEPDGIHTKWKERKKAYEDANETYKKQVERYENEKRSYKPRHDSWEARKNAHEEEVKQYKIKKALYDAKIDQIDQIRSANNAERTKANDADLKDPLFKDYIVNTGRYTNLYWQNKIPGNYKVEDRKNKDLSNEAERIRINSKTYQKMKKAAPDEVSKPELISYEQRKKEKAHIDTYPSGMRGFVRNLINEKKSTVREAGNAKDLTKEAYRDAALKSMYLSVVSRKTDEFAKTANGLLGHTKEIDGLLNKSSMDYAILQMKNNQHLISKIDDQYDSCKTKENRIRALQDGEKLNKIYDKAYTPVKKDTTVIDPVLKETHNYGEAQKNGPMFG